MLLKELLKYADIDYIAKAPPGKEVEQLTAKEITKASGIRYLLRNT